MDENIVGRLEEASRVFLAPTNMVSSEQRHAAEQVFINFRKTPAPYALCRYILESCEVDYVLFETINCLREALIKEWITLTDDEKESLVHYLMDYALNRTLATFVATKLLQVVAILVKRSSIDDFGVGKYDVLESLENMIRNGDTAKKIVGCKIVIIILQEFSVTIKSSDVGLTFEAHFRAKKQFEGNDLKKILIFCCEALGEIMKNKPPYPPEVLSVLGLLLKITDIIFCWGFIQTNVPKRLITVFESIYECEQPSSLRLTNQWKHLMTNPDLLRLFFTVHWNVRQYPEMIQHSLNCLMQLASLNGPALSTRDERVRYVTKFMEHFLELIFNINITGKEAFGFACTMRKLIAFFPPALLVALPTELLSSMLHCITHLTCSWCGLAIKEEQNYSEERLFIDSFENMMEVWVAILQDTYSITNHSVSDYLIQIFDTYVQARLYPPHGVREEEDEEQIEQDVGDCTDIKCKYKEQLQAVGLFGRHVAHHALPLLARLIEQEASRLHEALQLNQSNPQDNTSFFYKLHENLLWLVVITGHVLSMDSDGEMSLIPAEIMRYSMGQVTCGEIESTATVELLFSRNLNESLDRFDHAVRLITAVFRLAEVERQAAYIQELIVTMSPTLACNIIWFMKRFSSCYLLPEERYYTEISTSLTTAFGKDAPGSVWCMNFVLNKVEGNLRCFSFDADVVKATLDLLLSLVDTKDKAKTALKTDGVLKLLNLMKQDSIVFPEKCKRDLYKPMTLVASAIDSTLRASYWNEVPKQLCDRFHTLVHCETITRNFQEEPVKLEIMNILECFTGVAQGAHCQTALELVRLLYPVMAECGILEDLYHNYQEVVQLILEFFCACSRNVLCFLTEVESGKLTTAALEVVNVYTLRNKGRFSIEVAAEESAFQDIILLLELLTGLLSKDYVIDVNQIVLQHPVQSTSSTQEFDAADVVLYGLNTMMPLLTVELLKFPKLCLQYFKLITFVSELYPDKVCALPDDMLVRLMESVAMGISDLGHEVSILCYDLLEGLACYRFGARKEDPFADATLKKFIPYIFKMVLTRQISSDALPNAGTAVYALMCAYTEEYRSVVQDIISSQEDRRNAERLANAFRKLTLHFTMCMDRLEKRRFRDNFEGFVADVNGFLFVK